MAEKTVSVNSAKVLTGGMHSAIIGSDVVHDIPSKVVYVSSSSDLTSFANEPAGTIAIQYGLSSFWQKKPDGTWANV